MTTEPTPQTRANELVAQISQLELQGEVLEKQYEALSSYFAEMTLTIAVLEELSQAKVDDEILVPIGSNSWIHATLADVQEVIIGLGANVSASKDMASAREIIQERMKDAQTAIQQTGTQLEQARSALEQLRTELQGLINQSKG